MAVMPATMRMAYHERDKVIAVMPEITLANVKDFVGHSLGASDWIDVDQSRINQFAECTGDRQWIHIDIERAKREVRSAARSLTDTKIKKTELREQFQSYKLP
jgi:acyl dehydratase